MPALKTPAGGVAIAQFGEWTLYDMPEMGTQPSPLWLRFKLMLPPTTPRKVGKKAAFYLHWGVDAGRLRMDKYSTTLRRQDPEVYAQVEMWMSLYRDMSYVKSQFGLTDADIVAERRRLSGQRDKHIDAMISRAEDRKARRARGEDG